MAATLLTRPRRRLAPGVYGPRVGAPVTPGATAFEARFVNDRSFPTGGDVLAYRVDRSDDGGATWRHDATFTLGPGPWRDAGGNEVATGWVGATLGAPAGARTLLRETVTVLQRCSVGVTLVELP